MTEKTEKTDPADATVDDYRALFDASPTPSLVLSTGFEILDANAAILALTGRRRDEVVGLNIFDAFPDNPDDPFADGVAHLRASLERVVATGKADVMATQRYDVAPGAESDAPDAGRFEVRHWKPVNTPVLDAGGKVLRILHTVDEVARSHQARTRRLRDVLANVTDTIRDLKSADDIGYHAAAILGQAMGASRVGYGTIDLQRDVLTIARDWCAPGVSTAAGEVALRNYGSFIDDLKLDRVIAIADAAFDARTAARADVLRERSAAAFVNVPLVEHGELTALLFVNSAQPRPWTAEEVALIKEVAARIRTAAERLRGIAALRESEARFRTIADAMPQMVWSTLPDGFHDYYNEQWYVFTGVPRGSTDGDGWNNLFHPEDQARSRTAWQASLASGRTYEIQHRLRHHSGNYRWVLGRALPILDEQGRIIRWMGTCTDIHDQKMAEEELRQAARRKDEFLAMLAHELRNPLAPISSAAQLLILGQGQADGARVKKSGEIILRQVRHLTDLVDDLLDVSRVTRGLVQIEKSDLDLKDVIQSAVEQARPLIEARQHHLEVELTSAPTLVLGDKTRLVQVVVNLLNNAAKYTGQGGQIALSLEADAREAIITVTDNGSGIAPALLPYVFDLFVQAERTPDRAQGGLGLGLALVKRIAALHEGSVHALSEGLGQGSSFMILLPLKARDAAASPAAAQAGAHAGSGPARLMLVDDHVDGLQALGALLTSQGHAVSMATDGASALKLAGGHPFDVCILDIGLPDMDGYELARRLLAAAPAGTRPLMIALTGYGQPHDRVLSKAAGFDHHLVKPVDFAALTALLLQR